MEYFTSPQDPESGSTACASTKDIMIPVGECPQKSPKSNSDLLPLDKLWFIRFEPISFFSEWKTNRQKGAVNPNGLNESVLDWNMMLQGSAIKRLIYFFSVIGTWSWAANLSGSHCRDACLHVSKVTCWLYFHLIEIAWDQQNRPLWYSRKCRI